MRCWILRMSAVIVCACGGAHRGGAASGPLAWVPARSPIVVASLEPVPFDVVDVHADVIAPLFEVRREGGDFTQLLAALRAEWSREGIAALGLSPAPRFAFYLVDAVPVVRIEVRDAARAERHIGELAERTRGRRETLRGRTYWRYAAPQAQERIVAVHDGQVVIAWGPRDQVEAAIVRILGAVRPSRAMPVEELAAVRRGYRLGPIVGVVDVQRLLVARASRVTVPLLPECTDAIARVAARVPRIVGTYELAAKRRSLSLVVETAPDLAAEVRAAQVAFPPLVAELAERRFFTLGAAADVPRAHALARAALAALDRVATACNLAELRDELRDADALRAALPGPVATIRGAVVSLRTMSLSRGAYIPLPERIVGFGLLAAREVRPLFALLQLQDAISRLGIVADGELRTIAPDRLPFPMPFPLHAGVTERHVVIAADDNGRELAERALAETGRAPAPFVAGSLDWQRVLEVLETFERGERREAPETRVSRAALRIAPHAAGLGIVLELELK
ncbi:MAG: hypothetical protein KIT31_43070 [Deltaproteobacteria bacterium]|nr:hypothetical protein [Deltaproteobacteria bacterium]